MALLFSEHRIRIWVNLPRQLPRATRGRAPASGRAKHTRRPADREHELARRQEIEAMLRDGPASAYP
jgi:hypothetical protein